MKSKTIAVAILGLFTSVCSAQSALAVPTSGVISGTIRGSDGSYLASALVIASGAGGSARPGMATKSVAAALQSDGSFRLPPLPYGNYRVCVQASGSWLDPCEWGRNAPAVLLNASQPTPAINIVLPRGAPVSLRVIDPGQLLSTHEGKTPGAHLLIGTTTDALFFRVASVSSQDGAGRTYRMLLPFDRSVNIAVVSGFFQLSDVTGTALRTSSFITVNVASGQQPPTVVINLKSASR